MSTINYIEMEKRIREKRKEKGLTQAILAEKMGVSDRTIKDWEKGKMDGKINMPNLLELFSILDIDMNYLLGNDYSNVEVQKICEYTGLSEKTVNILNDSDMMGDKYKGEIISYFLDNYDNQLLRLLTKIHKFFVSKKLYEDANELYLKHVAEKKIDLDENERVDFFDRQANGDLMACMSVIVEMFDIAKEEQSIKDEIYK